jgi:glycosyltransferase involved in cell wall biosynthesis
MKYTFFSLRDFKIDVGETVRIYGLLNSLAASGHEIVFISNAERYEMFHSSIKHVFIDCRFNQKRKFQGLLSLFSYEIAYHAYKGLFKKINIALQTANVGNEPVYFFDYLDNSIGFVLKKKGAISKYINDVHGIATLEFMSHVQNSKTPGKKIINRFKCYMVDKLDKKVFEYADGLIYGSEHMRRYYEEKYKLVHKQFCIIPYLLGEDATQRKIDHELKHQLKEQLQIGAGDFVVLFVGTYKPTAGVDDLIMAFDRLFTQYADCKLFLVGSGPSKDHCLQLASQLNSNAAIKFIDGIPYNQLFTYQSLANVVVCPDKNNPYSHYVIHVKYFDALISGRLVINGAFESVKEINKDDFLSLTFEPSNIEDLYKKIKLCREGYDVLKEKYQHIRDYTAKNLTYPSYIGNLTNCFFTTVKASQKNNTLSVS